VAAKRTAKKASARRAAKKRVISSKRTSSKKTSSKKKTKAAVAKVRKPRKILREKAAFDRHALESRSGRMSGDLQGLRDSERADSESVSDLVEEGNAFEAGIVTGVEEAEDNPEQEVRSHQVPADDVPEEYLDEE